MHTQALKQLPLIHGSRALQSLGPLTDPPLAPGGAAPLDDANAGERRQVEAPNGLGWRGR